MAAVFHVVISHHGGAEAPEIGRNTYCRCTCWWCRCRFRRVLVMDLIVVNFHSVSTIPLSLFVSSFVKNIFFKFSHKDTLRHVQLGLSLKGLPFSRSQCGEFVGSAGISRVIDVYLTFHSEGTQWLQTIGLPLQCATQLVRKYIKIRRNDAVAF